MKFATGNRYKIAPKCPCGKSNKDGKFVPFEGFSDYGYCHSCGKTFYPDDCTHELTHIIQEARVSKHIPYDIIRGSMQNYGRTNLFKYLTSLFGEDKTSTAFRKYCIGTTPKGDTIYWYLDKNGLGRKGKVFKYGMDGHRQSSYYLSDYTNDKGFYGCIYGEHLLCDAGSDIILVEAEKTAIMASIYDPDLTFLATGGANSLTDEKANVLRDFNITLLPDADEAGRNSFKKIEQSLIKKGLVARMSDLFSERYDGFDLGDHIDALISYNSNECMS